MKRPKLFISRSSTDDKIPTVARFLADLKSDSRVKVWDYRDEVKIGDALIDKLVEGIRSSDFMVLIGAGPSGAYVNMEFRIAHEVMIENQRANIIPVSFTPDVKAFKDVSYIDMLNNYESKYERLIEEIVSAVQESLATFDIDRVVREKPILKVAGLVDRKIVQYFVAHPESMKGMDPRLFEELVAGIFDGFGYEVELTCRTRDGGRDVIAIKRKEAEVRYLIECKRPGPGRPIGIRPVRELYGVKCAERATKAILATTTYFTRDALLMFENHRWELEPRDYTGIVDWLSLYRSMKMSIS